MVESKVENRDYHPECSKPSQSLIPNPVSRPERVAKRQIETFHGVKIRPNRIRRLKCLILELIYLHWGWKCGQLASLEKYYILLKPIFRYKSINQPNYRQYRVFHSGISSFVTSWHYIFNKGHVRGHVR